MSSIFTNVVLTAYCACRLCCGDSATGLCADGKKPVEGRTIAGPRNVVLGTHVIVLGHEYVVEDRTARRFNGRWDVYFSKHADASKFGIKTNQTVVILQNENIQK